ncbi:MAG: iron-containing alcohol dehydrogenase [Thermodesulfobacteriota bacterium]
MENFVLHNQTKIIFGQETVAQIGAESAAFGKRALLVYGKGSLAASGLLAQIRASLKEAGLTVVEHGGINPNPLLSQVRAGIKRAKGEGVDVVVAAGGGSVIDAAKAISAGALVEHDVWKFFTGKRSIKATLPLTCVLTLAAAGSEMNGGMVITHDERKLKFGTGNKLLNPQVSILDPRVTCSVPRDYTVYGAIDAIAHILEFYFTTRTSSSLVQDRFMEGLVLSIMESCEQVCGDLSDYQGRAALMWCCTMALNGWTAAGLGLVGFPMHMIEHSLSAHYPVAHGAGLAVVMPAWLSWQAGKNPAKFAQFAQRVMACSPDGDDLQTALDGISRLKEWFAKMGAPTSLKEVGIPPQAIPMLAKESLPLARLWRLKDYDEKIIIGILNSCS